MKKRMMAVRFTVLALVALVLAPGALCAQNAAQLMQQMMDKQAERLAGVENLTIIQEVMGMETTAYMEKREVGGNPVLVPVSMTVMGMTNPVPQGEAMGDWSNPFQEAWIQRTRMVGEDEIDGHAVRVMLIDDFTDLDLPSMPGSTGESQDFRPSSMRFYVDVADLVMRRMEMKGEMEMPDGSLAPLEMNMVMDDFREVSGYLHPFVMRTTTKGMAEAIDMDQEEIRAQVDEMRKRLESMPASQRSMMEGMILPQMERLEGMLTSEDGMEIVVTVKDVKVNAGPPGGGN